MKTFLKEIAIGSGNILLDYLNKKNNINIKDKLGYVSDADLASEEYIIKSIEKEFPKSRIIAEEKGILQSEDRNSGLTWIIDPLDGTTNYIHGFKFFCVSIGVMENNELIAGIIYNPVLNELFYAEKGKGAFFNDNKIKVSKVDSFKDSLIITGFYYHQGEKLDIQIERFKKVQRITQSVRRLGSAALDICYVASGNADGFWEDGLSPWDIAAGTIILKESGGRFTDIDGNEGNIFGENFVYTNALIHDDLLKVLNN